MWNVLLILNPDLVPSIGWHWELLFKGSIPRTCHACVKGVSLWMFILNTNLVTDTEWIWELLFEGNNHRYLTWIRICVTCIRHFLLHPFTTVYAKNAQLNYQSWYCLVTKWIPNSILSRIYHLLIGHKFCPFNPDKRSCSAKWYLAVRKLFKKRKRAYTYGNIKKWQLR